MRLYTNTYFEPKLYGIYTIKSPEDVKCKNIVSDIDKMVGIDNEYLSDNIKEYLSKYYEIINDFDIRHVSSHYPLYNMHRENPYMPFLRFRIFDNKAESVLNTDATHIIIVLGTKDQELHVVCVNMYTIIRYMREKQKRDYTYNTQEVTLLTHIKSTMSGMPILKENGMIIRAIDMLAYTTHVFDTIK